MIIVDVRTRTKSGDIIRIGFCRGIRVDGHERTLTFAKPHTLRSIHDSGGDPVEVVKTFTAEVHPYVGRPGGYLLVQATDPTEWIPGWVPLP